MMLYFIKASIKDEIHYKVTEKFDLKIGSE